MKSTQAMRDRVRELSAPHRDDYDRAVECVLNDLEGLLGSPPPKMPSRLIDAIDSPTVAALAAIFDPRNQQNAITKSYSQQIVEVLAPRLCIPAAEANLTATHNFCLWLRAYFWKLAGKDELTAEEANRIRGNLNVALSQAAPPPKMPSPSPAASEEQLANLQYEAGMYQSLYENARAQVETMRAALDEISDLGADGETAARLGNIAHAALIACPSDKCGGEARGVDAKDWDRLLSMIDNSGHGQFWRERLITLRAFLHEDNK